MGDNAITPYEIRIIKKMCLTVCLGIPLGCFEDRLGSSKRRNKCRNDVENLTLLSNVRFLTPFIEIIIQNQVKLDLRSVCSSTIFEFCQVCSFRVELYQVKMYHLSPFLGKPHFL